MITQDKSHVGLCFQCPYFQAFDDDDRTRGLCHLFDTVSRGHHEQTQDCINEAEALEAKSQQRQVEKEAIAPKPTPFEPMIVAQYDPDPDILVDSVVSMLNRTFRVWKSGKLLGKFRQDIRGLWWVETLYGTKDFKRYKTAANAQAAIIACWHRDERSRQEQRTAIMTLHGF
ncbi:MAG: hypothetical protein NVS2B14_01240 [Chamaesiphon sp.]